MDRLIFLGTAGDNIVAGKQARASGGIVLQTEGMQFVIDPGQGTLTRAPLHKVNFRETTAILVSHSHLNHCSDLNAVISAATHNGLDKQAVLVCPESIIKNTEDAEKILLDYYRECLERTIIISSGNRIGINRIEVQVLEAKHNDKLAVGYKFLTSKFSMIYSGDTEYFKEISENYRETDLLILNVQEPFGKKEKNHLSADDAIKIIEKIKPNLCIITHFGNKFNDPMDAARIIQLKTNVQTLAAKDGMVINPVSYSAGRRQKTLNVY